MLAMVPIPAAPLGVAEAVANLAVTVTVAPSCTVRTTGDATDPVSVSCTKGTAARIEISAPESAGPDVFATQNPGVLVATINF